MPVSPVSVLIITRNEERNIAACLESVSWATERVVVDSGSTDATMEIARRYTDKVFFHEWQGYGEAKNFALARCTQPWVLWLDADERVTMELASEIQALLTTNPSVNAYSVARRAYFLGTWIRHCGWYPGYVTRLFRRENGRFSEHRVHEELIIEGDVKRLNNDLLHYTDNDLEHYFNKFNDYTTLAAQELIEQGKRPSMCDLLLRPPFTFLRMYVLRAGFLDGIHGLMLCALSAFYVFVKYAKARERKPL